MADHTVHHSPITETIIRGVKHNVTRYGAVTTLSVALTDSADPIVAGDNIALSCVVTNTGLNAANSVSLSVTLDPGFTYVSASGTGWTLGHSGQTVTGTLSSLAVGPANTITINCSTAINTAVSATSSASVSALNAPTANGSQNTTVKKVTKDATSGKYMPATNTEWTDFISIRNLTGISAPTSIYLCQDAASPLTDVNGSTFNLTISGSGDSYQQSVSGWSAKAAKLTDGTAGGWRSLSSSLPDPSTTSSASLSYILQPGSVPAASRNMVTHATANVTVMRLNITTGFLACASGGNIANGTNAPSAVVRPIGLRWNKTGGTCTGNSDIEKLAPTPSTPTGKQHLLGSTGATGAFGYLYSVRWDGSSAEISDANWKAMLQALGWTISWS